MIERLFAATAIKTSESSLEKRIAKNKQLKTLKGAHCPFYFITTGKSLFFNVFPIILFKQVNKHKENKDEY
jgi:hypothetical protein